MSLSSSIGQACPRCGLTQEVLVHSSLSIQDEDGLRAVVENRFNWFECSACGEQRPLELDLQVTDRRRAIVVRVVRADADVPENIAAMKSIMGDEPWFARIVKGREDLVEKFLILTERLNDAAVEVVKFLLRVQQGDLEGRAVRRFERLEGEQMIFMVHTPGRAPELYGVPFAVYQNALATTNARKHVRDFEVDERLARSLLEAKRTQTDPAPLSEDDHRLIALVERTRYRNNFLAAAPKALGATWCATETEPTILPSPFAPFVVERYITPGASPLHIAVTCGLGAVPVGDLADQHPRFEFAIVSPQLGPRIVFALSCLAHVAHVPERRLPLFEWDRVTFEQPYQGKIAGAVLRPFAALEITSDRPVMIFDLLPILPEELESFRADPPTLRAWVEARKTLRDEAVLHRRWALLPA